MGHHAFGRLSLFVLGASLALFAADQADAAKRSRPRLVALTAQTPLGLQGTAGLGHAVIVPFRLHHRSRRLVVVETEWGFDRDGDGEIADGTVDGKPSEYRVATHGVWDPRDTGRRRVTRNRSRSLYRPARGIGAAHAFAWLHTEEVGDTRHIAGGEPLRTPQGRLIFDPLDTENPLFSGAEGGVRLRLRGVRRAAGKSKVGEWDYTDTFSLDNTSRPEAEILAAAIDVSALTVLIDWRVGNDDSEDLNGNGVLDINDLEDINGNGILDTAATGVAFDYARLAPGETAPTSDEELARLTWWPCTQSATLGDADFDLPTAPTRSSAEVAQGHFASEYTFGWDFAADIGSGPDANGRYIVRATPYAASGALGDTAYWLDELQIDLGE